MAHPANEGNREQRRHRVQYRRHLAQSDLSGSLADRYASAYICPTG
jgi:hypothetical protein